MNYFNVLAYLGHGNVRVGGVWLVLYAILSPTHQTLLILLDTFVSLLQVNYLQNIIIAYTYFFTWLEMLVSVHRFLNSKLIWAAVLKSCGAS